MESPWLSSCFGVRRRLPVGFSIGVGRGGRHADRSLSVAMALIWPGRGGKLCPNACTHYFRTEVIVASGQPTV